MESPQNADLAREKKQAARGAEKRGEKFLWWVLTDID
jgi:hypothetical protein